MESDTEKHQIRRTVVWILTINDTFWIFSSCFLSQLEKHLERCNSKPQPLPEYIKENINVADSDTQEEIKINLGALPDDELLAIINKVSKIHSGG